MGEILKYQFFLFRRHKRKQHLPDFLHSLFSRIYKFFCQIDFYPILASTWIK